MAWRAARSLLTLRDQIDAMFPDRSRISDGIIGDAAHAATASDHNPDAGGVVRALDITHDPASGCDIGVITDALAASRDSRISYVIANRLIMSGGGGPSPWVWRPYGGSDPHTNHLHLSVVGDARADDASPWSLAITPTDPGDATPTIGTTMRGQSMVIATDGKTFVLTDWDTWHDRSLSYEQVVAFREAGVPQVPVSAETMVEILGLPEPRKPRPQVSIDVSALADEVALSLISRIAERGA